MKKLLLLFSLCSLVLFASCDPPQNEWRWWVKNGTEQTLKLKYPYYSIHTSEYRIFIIAPSDSVCVFSSTLEARRNKYLSFDYYLKKSSDKYGEEVYWQILSESDEILKTWNYSDKGLADQRFFKKSSWLLYQRPANEALFDMDYSWTFEIRQEDIDSE